MSDREREPWTDDDLPPTEEEQQQARQLAARVDGLLAGERPVAGDELVSAAAMVLTGAAARAQRLDPAARDRLVSQALAESGAARTGHGRLRRLAPALALAASLVLLIGALLSLVAAPRAPLRARRPPVQLLSRPSDDLMGRPFEDRAGASRRLDLVFADRWSGYRMLTLRTGEEEP